MDRHKHCCASQYDLVGEDPSATQSSPNNLYLSCGLILYRAGRARIHKQCNKIPRHNSEQPQPDRSVIRAGAEGAQGGGGSLGGHFNQKTDRPGPSAGVISLAASRFRGRHFPHLYDIQSALFARSEFPEPPIRFCGTDRAELPFAPVCRVNIEQALGACVDPTDLGEATSADKHVRLPLDNADLNVVIAWCCRYGLPFHGNMSRSIYKASH